MHKQTKALRAVKIINKKCLEEEEKLKMLNEISILKKMVRNLYIMGSLMMEYVGSSKYTETV